MQINLENADLNNQRHINLLHPKHRSLFTRFVQKCKDSGYPIWIYSSYRDYATQQELYNRYVSGQSLIKAARPGNSYHNYGLAIDVYVYNESLGKFDRKSSYNLYKILSSIANSLGLRWLGSWQASEMAHFDYNIYNTEDLKYLFQNGLVDGQGYVLLERISQRVPNTVNKSVENYSTEIGQDFMSITEETEEIPEKQPQRVITRVEKMKANGIWQIVKLVADQFALSQYVNDASFAQSQGSLYNFIQNVVQEPWLQFFGDTVGDQYYFFCRREPFDYNGWTVLPIQQNIEANQVLADDLKWYDGPVFSWYQIIPRGSFLGEQNLIFAYITAVFFEEYAEIFGSKPLIHVSNYINFGKNLNKPTMTAKALDDLRYMVESNAYLPFTRSGTITIYGRSNIKRGYRIRYFPTDEVFYVNSVSHRYSMGEEGPEYTTVLEVIRGMRTFNMVAPEDSSTKSYFNLINFEKQEPRVFKQKVMTQQLQSAIVFYFDNDRTYLIDMDEEFQNNGVDLKMVEQIEKFPTLRQQLHEINNKMIDIAANAIETYHDAPNYKLMGFVDSDLKATYKKLATDRALNVKAIIIESYLAKYSTLTREQLEEKIITTPNITANTYVPLQELDDNNQLIFEETTEDPIKIKAYSRFCDLQIDSYERIEEKTEQGEGIGWKVNKEVFQYFLNRKQNSNE